MKNKMKNEISKMKKEIKNKMENEIKSKINEE